MSFRPLYTGNDIIESFLKGQQVAHNQKQLALEKERLAQEKDLAQQRLEQEQEDLKQRHEYQTAQIDFMRQAHELQKLAETQSIVERYQDKGVLPTGSSVQKPVTGTTPDIAQPQFEGAAQPIPAPISKTLGLGVDQVKLSIPGLGDTTVESPESVAAKVGELSYLRDRPKFELENLKLQAEVQKQLQQQKFTADQNNLNRKSRADIAEADRLNRFRVAQERTAATIAAAKARGVTDKVLQQVTSFETSDITKRLTALNVEKAFADDYGTVDPKTKQVTLTDTGKTGSDDLGLIYAYVRAQDPNAVKEGEVANIERYGQAIGATFTQEMKRVFNNETQKLSDDARKAMIGVINRRYEANAKVYKSVRSQYAKTMRTLGEADPESLLHDRTVDDTSSRPSLDELFPVVKKPVGQN